MLTIDRIADRVSMCMYVYLFLCVNVDSMYSGDQK